MATLGNRKLKSFSLERRSLHKQPKIESQGVIVVSADVIFYAPESAISIVPIMPEGFITDTQLMPPRFE
jgi:hypothetical protein